MLFRRKQKHEPIHLPAFSFCRELDSFDDWPASLPDVNGQMLAKRLLDAVEEILNADCDASQLKHIASALRESFIKARDNLYAIKPSPEHARSLARLKQHFFGHYGTLFHSVGMAEFDKDDLQSTRQFLPLAAECFSESIIASLELYRPPLPGSWANLHSLHVSLVTRCTDPKLVEQVAEFYKYTIILSCLQTAQLNNENIQLLRKLVQPCLSEVKILPSPQENCSHKIHVGRDQAPEKTLEPETVSIVGDQFYISLGDLTKIESNPACSNPLKQHLQRVSEFKSQEKDKRTKVQEALTLCLSLKELHQQLAKSGFENFVESCQQHSTEEQNATALVDKDIWNNATDVDWSSIQQTDELVEFEMHENLLTTIDNSTSNKQGYNAMTLDTSKNGYLIACEAEANVLEAGSLIGIQTKGSDDWIVAAVRWQKNEAKFNKFGVEKIGVNPAPACIKIIHSSNKTNFLPALRLQTMPGTGQLDEVPGEANDELDSEIEQINEAVVAIPRAELRDKTPALYMDIDGDKRGIIKDVIEENARFLICLIRFAD